MKIKEEINDLWHKFWNQESTNIEQGYMIPDTHGIIRDFISQTRQADVEGLIEWAKAHTIKLTGKYGTAVAIDADDLLTHLTKLKENI